MEKKPKNNIRTLVTNNILNYKKMYKKSQETTIKEIKILRYKVFEI